MGSGGVSSFACASKLLSLSVNLKQDTYSYLGQTIIRPNHLESPFGDALNSGLMSSTQFDHEVLSEAGPSAKIHDNTAFAYDQAVTHGEMANTLTELSTSMSSASLKHNCCAA